VIHDAIEDAVLALLLLEAHLSTACPQNPGMSWIDSGTKGALSAR